MSDKNDIAKPGTFSFHTSSHRLPLSAKSDEFFSSDENY